MSATATGSGWGDSTLRLSVWSLKVRWRILGSVHHACKCKLQSYYRAPITTTCSAASRVQKEHLPMLISTTLITPICMPMQAARQSLCSLVSFFVLSALPFHLASHGKISLVSDEASRTPYFAWFGYRASTICTSSHVRLLFNTLFYTQLLIFLVSGEFAPIILSACRPFTSVHDKF